MRQPGRPVSAAGGHAGALLHRRRRLFGRTGRLAGAVFHADAPACLAGLPLVAGRHRAVAAGGDRATEPGGAGAATAGTACELERVGVSESRGQAWRCSVAGHTGGLTASRAGSARGVALTAHGETRTTLHSGDCGQCVQETFLAGFPARFRAGCGRLFQPGRRNKRHCRPSCRELGQALPSDHRTRPLQNGRTIRPSAPGSAATRRAASERGKKNLLALYATCR